jgi:hypothetical protein
MNKPKKISLHRDDAAGGAEAAAGIVLPAFLYIVTRFLHVFLPFHPNLSLPSNIHPLYLPYHIPPVVCIFK